MPSIVFIFNGVSSNKVLFIIETDALSFSSYSYRLVVVVDCYLDWRTFLYWGLFWDDSIDDPRWDDDIERIWVDWECYNIAKELLCRLSPFYAAHPSSSFFCSWYKNVLVVVDHRSPLGRSLPQRLVMVWCGWSVFDMVHPFARRV